MLKFWVPTHQPTTFYVWKLNCYVMLKRVFYITPVSYGYHLANQYGYGEKQLYTDCFPMKNGGFQYPCNCLPDGSRWFFRWLFQSQNPLVPLGSHLFLLGNVESHPPAKALFQKTARATSLQQPKGERKGTGTQNWHIGMLS